MRISFFGLLLIAACGGAEDPGSCPNDLPASCPADAATYASGVAPIIAARCMPCHSPGGEAEERPLNDYADVYARRSAVLNQVHACKMPPAGAVAPTADERAALLGWLVCGAPNN